MNPLLEKSVTKREVTVDLSSSEIEALVAAMRIKSREDSIFLSPETFCRVAILDAASKIINDPEDVLSYKPPVIPKLTGGIEVFKDFNVSFSEIERTLIETALVLAADKLAEVIVPRLFYRYAILSASVSVITFFDFVSFSGDCGKLNIVHLNNEQVKGRLKIDPVTFTHDGKQVLDSNQYNDIIKAGLILSSTHHANLGVVQDYLTQYFDSINKEQTRIRYFNRVKSKIGTLKFDQPTSFNFPREPSMMDTRHVVSKECTDKLCSKYGIKPPPAMSQHVVKESLDDEIIRERFLSSPYLPEYLYFEGIEFKLRLDCFLGNDGFKISYKINRVTPTSKHYYDVLSKGLFKNPIDGEFCSYIFLLNCKGGVESCKNFNAIKSYIYGNFYHLDDSLKAAQHHEKFAKKYPWVIAYLNQMLKSIEFTAKFIGVDFIKTPLSQAIGELVKNVESKGVDTGTVADLLVKVKNTVLSPIRLNVVCPSDNIQMYVAFNELCMLPPINVSKNINIITNGLATLAVLAYDNQSCKSAITDFKLSYGQMQIKFELGINGVWNITTVNLGGKGG